MTPEFLVGDRWRALYRPPVEKRTADLQWRIIHRAIATDQQWVGNVGFVVKRRIWNICF